MIHRVQKKTSTKELISGINNGNRLMLSRAITLIESKNQDDQGQASELIDTIITHNHESIRIGITGVPGVGKSTFIESFGLYAISKGNRVAVLSVDPSSPISMGSIMGDKTRMPLLSQHKDAYIRPSPSGDTSGGVASKTRESILLCEAAGFDLIIVETMGVGQAEVVVKGMIDFFQVLMLAGAGDELQGIKRGIMEMADGIAINKADGENLKAAKLAKTSIESALHYFSPHPSGWIVPVEICSAIEGAGIDKIWNQIVKFQKINNQKGLTIKNRQDQNIRWMRELIDTRIKEEFYNRRSVKDKLSSLRDDLINGVVSPRSAVDQLFSSMRS